MKFLINLLILSFITCFQSTTFYQSIGFEVENDKGTISNVFSNQSNADRFLNNPIF